MEISERLTAMGFDPGTAGTKYLADCIRIYADSGCLAKFTEIYALIAERYGRSSNSVMKAMKYALDRAVLAGGEEALPVRLVRENGGVTVREFVAAFAFWPA